MGDRLGMPTARPLQRRLVEVWTWLPAFRAVAEVEHMQRAARELHVTPSSLSRAVRLVEESLGVQLFDRIGRNVKLNPAGAELLAAVRDGMRRMDDGIGRVTGTVFSGELRVACEGDQPIAFAWRAAAFLLKTYPALEVTIEEAGSMTALAPRLLRGELDVAIVGSSSAQAKLRTDHLGDLTYGIYCGEGHPLWAKRDATAKTIASYPFVAPTLRGEGGPRDQWPTGVERTVALRLPALAPAIEVCASGALLAVLPDLAVAGALQRRSLRRLRSDDVPPSPLFAIRRRAVGEAPTADRAGSFVEALAAEVSLRSKTRRGRR